VRAVLLSVVACPGKAMQAACRWIQANYDGAMEHYFLESNFATDKKHSAASRLAWPLPARPAWAPD
jgi:hypothetical protein